MKLLHHCLTHLNVQNITKLLSIVTELFIKNAVMSDVCKPCAQGKQIREQSHTSATRAKNLFNLMHIDLIELIHSQEYDRSSYALMITDDYSRVS